MTEDGPGTASGWRSRDERRGVVRRRWMRLRDPDAGLPYPPPGYENIFTMGLFAVTALVVAILTAIMVYTVGPQMIFGLTGACAYLLALAWGVWRIRPRESGELWFRIWLAPVTGQALFLAAGSYQLAMHAFGRPGSGRFDVILLGGSVFFTFAGIGASFVLQSVARRAGDLVFAQFLGPSLLLMSVAATAAFL